MNYVRVIFGVGLGLFFDWVAQLVQTPLSHYAEIGALFILVLVVGPAIRKLTE